MPACGYMESDMPANSDRHYQAAVRLDRYLFDQHWNGRALIGPDVGIRFNYRIGRFLKGYLAQVAWKDDYYYVQGQAYWILANWRLWLLNHDRVNRDIAMCCSADMMQRQRADGAWEYPNVEWKGRVATAEGTWGSLGLLETYRQTGDQSFLSGALRWYRYLIDTIGFQRANGELAVNYFAHRGGTRVPNNAAFVLRFLAELSALTGQSACLDHCAGLLAFLQGAQYPTGEFPYTVRGVDGESGRAHFQCYQYNAFQCLDLMRYYEVTGDQIALPLISSVLRFLGTGVARDAHAAHDCNNRSREVTYHTAVLAAAFTKADHMGMDGYAEQAQRLYAHLIRAQRRDGSFIHSRRDYGVLSDRRSYPRNLAMILYLLLEPWVSALDAEPRHGVVDRASGVEVGVHAGTESDPQGARRVTARIMSKDGAC
jgi:hypothetical protein